MRAVSFHRYGPPEVLEVVEIPEPEVGLGEVRVRVRAAGVQSFDAKLRSGSFQGFVPVTFPQRLGNEFAGVIDMVGPGVLGWHPGDEVLGFTRLQAYADAIVIPATDITRKPGGLDWLTAGALTAPGQTASLALDELGVISGETVLIHAAAGGVGTMAVQLARLRAAQVIGTASIANHDYLRRLGAEPVEYGPGLAERIRTLAPNGVDAALDAIGGESNQTSVDLVRDRSRAGTIVDYQAVRSLGVRMLGGQRSAALLRQLADLVADGLLRVEIAMAVELADVASAHRHVDTGHTRGRVVIGVEDGQ